MQDYVEQLADLGVEGLDDLQYLDEETIKGLRAKPIHKRKLAALVQKHRA